MIADLLSEAFVVHSIEGTQSQLGEETVWEKCRVVERSLDLDPGCLCLVFVLLVIMHDTREMILPH